MATIEEIKEDFLYIYVVELAFLISLIFNFVYYNQWNNIVKVSLIFWAIFIFEDKLLNSFILSKTKDLKIIFGLIKKWKKTAKAALAFYLSVLIMLSSWGIVAYLSLYIRDFQNTVKIAVEIIPYYIAIYVGWLFSLTYIKGKYTKFVLFLLKKKKR